MHKKPRRGRSKQPLTWLLLLQVVKAVTKVIPTLEGKLTSRAVRVPTPNVSLAILKLTLNTKTNIEELNNIIREESLKGRLVNQINYQVDPDLVSSDIIGDSCCSVFDL